MRVLLTRPPFELVFLMAVGLADLVSTVVLYEFGLIVELNPLMRPLLDASTALFSAVKLATLAAAYLVLQAYRKTDEAFVRRASLVGAVAYVVVWCVWAGLGSTGLA